MNKYEAGGFFIRSLNQRKSFGRCLFRLISPPMRFPPQAVMGGSSPCTPEPGDFSRGCRPAYADNDPLDHCPGALALLDLNSESYLIGQTAWFPLVLEGTRKSDLAPLCFWPGGEAANPDASHPGKARE